MTIHDPVFGRLESNDDGWIGAVVLEGLFAQTLRIRISGHRHQPPREHPRTAMTRLLEHQHKLKAPLEHAIFAYYCENVLPTRMEDHSTDADLVAPLLEHPSQIWTLVRACELRFGFERNQPEMVFIGFEVPWDEEHGMDVYVKPQSIGVGIEAGHWSDYSHHGLKGERP